NQTNQTALPQPRGQVGHGSPRRPHRERAPGAGLQHPPRVHPRELCPENPAGGELRRGRVTSWGQARRAPDSGKTSRRNPASPGPKCSPVCSRVRSLLPGHPRELPQQQPCGDEREAKERRPECERLAEAKHGWPPRESAVVRQKTVMKQVAREGS